MEQAALTISQLWRLVHQPGYLDTLSKILIKVASWLTTWKFKEGLKETAR